MVERRTTGPITIERQWFIDSRQGNIKDEYYFEKKLGSGGYGAVYLAKHKKTGKFAFIFETFAFHSVANSTLSLSIKIRKSYNLEKSRKTNFNQILTICAYVDCYQLKYNLLSKLLGLRA